MLRKATLILLALVLAVPFVALAQTYNEAPMLAARVAAGELPPVDQRLPENPMVVEPFHEIGQHGGTLRTYALTFNWGPPPIGTQNQQSGLVSADADGKNSLGLRLAEHIEFADDFTSSTIRLRKGLRWSDGAPMTVDDILFMWNDVHQNKELRSNPWGTWVVDGQFTQAEKIDDQTVRFQAAGPIPAWETHVLTGATQQGSFYAPAHYLQKWHADHNEDAAAVAKEEGFDGWTQAFEFHADWWTARDMDTPRMYTWILTDSNPSAKLFERNPYFWQVDTAGNQLPYIDHVQSEVVSLETWNLKILSGEADFARHFASLNNFPLYKENEEAGGYTTYLQNSLVGNDVALGFNFNQEDAVLRALYHDIRFRRALSVAIDRDEISEEVYFGQAVPRSNVPIPSLGYFKPEWETAWSQYDPDLANQLLDEAGLTARDRDGIRLRSDGEPLAVTILYAEYKQTVTATLELVQEYWEDVGVKTVLDNQPQGAPYGAAISDPDHPMNAWEHSRSDGINSWLHPWHDYLNGGSKWVPRWSIWSRIVDGGEEYDRPGDTITYDLVKERFQFLKAWQLTQPGSAEHTRMGQEYFDWWTDQVWTIGTVGLPPAPFTSKNGLGNVGLPDVDFPRTHDVLRPTAFASQWYWKDAARRDE
jgi:peptide/nickel transport system substrate-binding protein